MRIVDSPKGRTYYLENFEIPIRSIRRPKAATFSRGGL
jgi:hypothetical protein